MPHWVRGEKEQARIISNRRDFVPPLNILALGNSVGTGPKGVTAPVIEIQSFEELEQKKDQVKGKIVFYNYPFNKKFVKPFIPTAMPCASAERAPAGRPNTAQWR